MAKTAEDLQRSEEARREITARYGGKIPESILVHDKTDRAIDLMADERNYDAQSLRPSTERPDSDHGGQQRLYSRFTISGMSARNGALSRFPQNVGRQLVRFYTNELDNVVDPFAGHNSRMELCWRLNRNYYGSDISERFMEANERIQEFLENLPREELPVLREHFKAKIELKTCDARNLLWEDNLGDFTITSPPYYDLEYYGDEPEQLGQCKTYANFLNDLARCAEENFRVLKAGSFCVWCVNDFRRAGHFHSYHSHTIWLMRKAGFIHHDTAIVDLGSAFLSAFATQVDTLKVLPKRHEYALVFRKPQTQQQ